MEKVDETKCPFCGFAGRCPHMIGWTDDGKTLESAHPDYKGPILETDRLVTTGVSCRVYRDNTPTE